MVGELKSLTEYPEIDLRSAEDVVWVAARWPSFGRLTFPEILHLDERGANECGWLASSLCSLVRWATDPGDLETALEQARLDGCTHDRWLVVDSRPSAFADLRPPVTEADAKAFIELRTWLGGRHIDLVDAVVFNDRLRWWSMRELTMGTTRWLPEGAPDTEATHAPSEYDQLYSGDEDSDLRA